jgi:tetratricopeptide (TPR) repeat protein
VIFEHENSFTKQILVYWKEKQFDKAHELCKEFASTFPNSLIAHYLLAKCYFRRKEFPLALTEGHKAFNLSESEEDLIGTGVFLACVYYELRRYSKGHEILDELSHFGDERIEKALFIFSLCMNDPTEAMMHVDALYVLNKEVANKFVDKFLALAHEIAPG